MYDKMPCPICKSAIGRADHRMCLLELLKSGTVNTAKEWEKMSADKPVTIRKGKIKAVLPKE